MYYRIERTFSVNGVVSHTVRKGTPVGLHGKDNVTREMQYCKVERVIDFFIVLYVAVISEYCLGKIIILQSAGGYNLHEYILAYTFPGK